MLKWVKSSMEEGWWRASSSFIASRLRPPLCWPSSSPLSPMFKTGKRNVSYSVSFDMLTKTVFLENTCFFSTAFVWRWIWCHLSKLVHTMNHICLQWHYKVFLWGAEYMALLTQSWPQARFLELPCGHHGVIHAHKQTHKLQKQQSAKDFLLLQIVLNTCAN